MGGGLIPSASELYAPAQKVKYKYKYETYALHITVFRSAGAVEFHVQSSIN
jgi:hypothetical protein